MATKGVNPFAKAPAKGAPAKGAPAAKPGAKPNPFAKPGMPAFKKGGKC